MSNMDYDKTSDVMYITLGDKPRKGIADEVEEGIFIRKSDNGAVVGVTIMNFDGAYHSIVRQCKRRT